MAHLRGGGVFLGTENTLGDTLAVADVHENDAVMIPNRINPADQRNRFTGVGFAEFVAMMSSVHG
jgi:hypothetical protein